MEWILLMHSMFIIGTVGIILWLDSKNNNYYWSNEIFVVKNLIFLVDLLFFVRFLDQLDLFELNLWIFNIHSKVYAI